MNVWIKLEVTSVEYKALVDHITKNMFFGIRRMAPNLQHMLFHSVGDAMFDDLQDITNAEIFLQQKISDDQLDPKILSEILKSDKWYISVEDPRTKKVLAFIVEKESDFILFRQEKYPDNERSD